MTDDERKRMFDALTDPGEEDNIMPAGYVDYLAHATDEEIEAEYDRRFPIERLTTET